MQIQLSRGLRLKGLRLARAHTQLSEVPAHCTNGHGLQG